MPAPPKVYIIDNNINTCRSISWNLQASGFNCTTYQSASLFFEDLAVNGRSCVIVSLPGSETVELLHRLQSRPGQSMPMIVLAEPGDVRLAVQSLKLGAVDVFEKPGDLQSLIDSLHQAHAIHAKQRAERASRNELQMRLNQLTAREREVLSLLCKGKSTKEMASLLKISNKTVSIHRGHVMKKMQAGSATDAVRLAMEYSGGEIHLAA